MIFGYIATGLILGGFVWLSFLPQCVSVTPNVQDCGTHWHHLISSPFNEIGDALAGFAGALAFVWLIVTVLIQGRELAAQREELALARQESERMAEALEAQADVFRDEQRQRREDRAERLVNELIHSAVSLASPMEKVIWKLKKGGPETSQMVHERTLFPRGVKAELSIEAKFQRFCSHVQRLSKEVGAAHAEALLVSRPQFGPNIELLEEKMLHIAKVVDELSDDQRERLERLGAVGAADVLRNFASEDFWEGRALTQ